MNNGFYILEDGEQRGPFSFNELVRMDIDSHTQILTPSAEEWQYAFDIPELYPYFKSKGIYFPTADNLASFGWRLLAWIVDIVILAILLNIVVVVLVSNHIIREIPAQVNMLNIRPEDMGAMQTMQLIVCVLLLIYNTACEVSPMKGSIGKRICRLVVVDVDGNGLSFFQSLLRSVGKLISMLLFNIGFLFALFTEHKQALHDKMAKSYVVKL